MERPSIIKQFKTPKKIDYWYYAKTENLLREQIDLLKSELERTRELVREISKPNIETPEVPINNKKEYQPVGRANPARTLAEMEARDREDYWKKEIKRREDAAKTEGNVIEAES